MLEMVILGVVQGLTEFLPVSSTAHLIFAETLLGIARPGILLEAVLHIGTALAAIILFRDDVRRLATGWVSTVVRRPHGGSDPFGRLAWLIILMTALTAALGLLFAAPLEQLFGSLEGTAVQLIVTGALLLLARERGRRAMTEATVADAAVIGLAQAVAIMPGISRSATTIVSAMWAGMRKDEAARLSFLAAIPAVLGAGLFGLKDVHLGTALGYTPAQLTSGLLVSAASGALAIRWLLAAVRRGRLRYFAVYCVAAGAVMLLL